jgi:serine/threonine protein kinase
MSENLTLSLNETNQYINKNRSSINKISSSNQINNTNFNKTFNSNFYISMKNNERNFLESSIKSPSKILNKSNIMKSNQTQHVLNELEIIPNLDHPSIIKFLSFYQDDKYLYLAFEFIPGGDLFTLLKAENNLSIEQSQFYLGQIIFALEYLHSRNIIYRNLKPENILINKNGYIKLTDFELVKNLDDRTYTLCGTPGYMAPEIILNKGYGLGVDWWALGILLYEMICGVDPFADESPMKIYENILEGKIKFTSDFDDTSKSLIKHLLDKDISRRYGNL